MSYSQLIKSEFIEAQQLLNHFIDSGKYFVLIEKAALLMADSIEAGRKIISCGNGGSHCDAMHFAEELTGRYRSNRSPLPALAISDPSYLSCVGNDFGYEMVFSRFVEGLGQEGDVLLALSTSGRSASIKAAVKAARIKMMKTIVLTGKDGGEIKGMGDIEICVPHFGYADRIQEIHIKIIHSIILVIEQKLVSKGILEK